MRYQIHFDKFPTYVRVINIGEASVDDIVGMMDTLLKHSLWREGTPLLIDNTRLINTFISFEKMQRITESLLEKRQSLGQGGCAFVVADSCTFGFARMYESLGGRGVHGKVGVFYDYDEAVKWLKENTPDKASEVFDEKMEPLTI